MKILIADDEEVIRSSLEAILKKGGNYEIEFALDGEEAVKKAKDNLYDMVLCDLEMPKLSGYEVLKAIRGMYADMPVVFITGTGDVHKLMQSIAKDKLNAFIQKPFTPDKVLDIVGKALKAKSPGV